MSIDAMKQALDALEYIYTETTEEEDKLIHAAITALRLAIEQAERQEPVAWLWQHSETGRTRIVMPDSVITADANWIVVGPLYLGAAPPQRQPLTKEQRKAIEKANTIGGDHGDYYDAYGIMEDVELAHGIGGGE